MAIFFPEIEKIQKFKVQPTEGEWTLLNFLKDVLDDSYEVYFNPYLNGDRPDVIIMKKGCGAMIIEVKDWNLNNFHLNENKMWVLNSNESVVKSPIDQVYKYKKNLFDLHVDELFELKLKDIRNFNIVSCAVYFHCANKLEIDNMLVKPYMKDKKYQDFLKYNIDFIGADSLTEDKFKALLEKRYLSGEKTSKFFSKKIYENFKRILSPSNHLMSEGEDYKYTPKQLEIIYSTKLEQRVRGVFGSGKTTVLAARAVQAYKRALNRNNNPRILILTYNITLKNFIHDKLNKVREDFPPQNFIIINYHQFINAELNNLNIEFKIPDGIENISEYLEKEYYGNIELFEKHKAEIVKYDAVFIDEIQDYHRPWMEIIKNYFRDPEGDYILFGDVKQNIYGQQTENKDVVTNVRGVNELKYCFRSDFKVRDLAQSFQRNIFKDKYDIDDFSENENYAFMGTKEEKLGNVEYTYLQSTNFEEDLYNIIRARILNENSNISPNDITILGYNTSFLRSFDLYYRYASREKTKTMLETVESMYMTHLNYIKNNDNDQRFSWFYNINNYLKKKRNIIDLRKKVAVLFAIYDLNSKFENRFVSRLEEKCKMLDISLEAFCAYRKHYQEQLSEFVKKVYSEDYKNIRDNKKLHFWMNSGTIKISTINSFKGWESEVVFLIIEPDFMVSNTSFDELIYTGLTRCKKNLVIINLGNKNYDSKIRSLAECDIKYRLIL